MTIPEDTFREEVQALLADSDMAQALFAELESALQALKERPEDIELAGRVFRVIDKLKGGGK